MPRDITVTMDDGTRHVYRNAPDNITPQQAQARAQNDFGGAVVSMDGGRSIAAPDPNLIQQRAQHALQVGELSLQHRMEGMSPADRAITRQDYYNDPQIQGIRQRAGLPAQLTPAERIALTAKNVVDQEVSGAGNFATSLLGGARRSMFGIPERIGAGVLYLTQPGNTSYDNILQLVRAKTDEEMSRSTPGNVAGTVGGSLIGGGLLSKAVTGIGGMLAASRLAPNVLQTVGRAVQASQTLKQGATAANVGKLALTGGVMGGAQAAGEGGDVERGAEYGAALGPLAVGGGKAASWLGSRAADILGVRGIGPILRSVTSATKEQLQSTIDRYHAQGINPTLFEVLPLEDRNHLAKAIVGRSDATLEQAQQLVQQRAANIGPEMASRAEAVTAPGRAQIASGIEADLANARGGTPDPADAATVEAGTQSGLDMKNGVRSAESDAIMSPVRDTTVAGDVSELYPQAPVRNPKTGTVQMTVTDPEAARVIQAASGSLGMRKLPNDPTATVAGISGNDAANIMTQLGKIANGADPIMAGAAQRAQVHVQQYLDANAPDVGKAISQMRDAYAGRSRMAEGMNEGEQTRLRSQAPNSGAAGQKTLNAYDTPEGTQGRFLGQANQLQSRFLDTTPESSARAAATLPADARALEANLGAGPAGQLQEAAGLQTQAQRSLAGLRSPKQGSQDIAPEDLAGVVFGLSPHSMIRTKLWAIDRLMNVMRLPKGKASVMVDMLLSQDPAKFSQAFNLLNTNAGVGRKFLRQFMTAAAAGDLGAEVASSAAYNPGGQTSAPAAAPTAAPNSGVLDGDGNPISGEPHGKYSIDAHEAARIATEAGFTAGSGDRTVEEQAYLYAHDRRPDNPVAYPSPDAPHVRGNALDIPFGNGASPESLRQAYAAKGVRLTKVLREHGHYHIEWA